MPSDEEIDNANGGGNDPKPQSFQIDTTDLDRRIADGVSQGMAKVFQQYQPKPQPVDDPTMRPQVIDVENDDVQTQINKSVHNATLGLRKQVNELQEFGLNKFAELTDATAGNALAYRNEFRTEIDEELNKLPAAARTNIETLKLVHDRVVVRHLPEIQKRAVEAEQNRLLQEDAQRTIKGANSRQVDTEGNTIPEPGDLFDESQLSMINERGGKDAFARKVSLGKYENWGDYAKARMKMASQPKREGMVTIPFRRMTNKATSK